MTLELDVENLPAEFELGHYVIKSLIAVGGMGVVYKAYEPLLKRTVAIKVLRRAYAADPEAVFSFQEEARAVAAISHPNIVPIHYIGTDGGCAFFSMAFVEGCTLDDWIEHGQFFTEEDAFWFLDQAIAALSAAMRAKIVHLDIKPSNFLINHQGQIFLSDFGLARNLAGVGSGAQNKSGMGTPYYVAPEQILQVQTDQRTDIYSLGATLFHLMVKQPPFSGNNAKELLKGHIYGEFPATMALAAGVSQGWVAILRKMLEKELDQRYADYDELSAAVNSLKAASKPTVDVAAPKRADVVETEVFIAYSDPDAETARQVCEFLEQLSMHCWLAHRDIAPGASRATSFVLAISRTKVIVVLLSKHSNLATQLQREVEEAAHFGKPIITVRLEDVDPCEDLALLNKTLRLDAFSQTLPSCLDNLAQTVERELGELKAQEKAAGVVGTVSKNRTLYTRVAILSCLALFCLGLSFVPPRYGASSSAAVLTAGEKEALEINLKAIWAEESSLAPLPRHPVGHAINLTFDQYYAIPLDKMTSAVDLFAEAGVNRIDLTPPAAYWGPHFIEVDQSLCAYIRKKGMQVEVAPPFGQLDTSAHPLTMKEFQDRCCDIDQQIASALHPDDFFVISNVQVILKNIDIEPRPSVEDWAGFVTATCASVKKVDANIKLGIAGNAASQELLKNLLKLPCVDVIGLDIYSIPDLAPDRSIADLATQAHKAVFLRRTWHPDADKQQWSDFASEENQEVDSKWIAMIDHYAATGPFDSVSYYDGAAFFVYEKGKSASSSEYMSDGAEAAARKQTTTAYAALKELSGR